MLKDVRFVSASVLALGLVVLGLTIRSGIITFKDRDRVVSVRGLAEREVMANKVTWSLQYKEMGNDASEMYETLDRKNKLVVDFLKEGGLKDDEISVNPPTISDRQADSYSTETYQYRYRATSVITVSSTDVEKVRKLLGRQTELMKQDVPIINDEYGRCVEYEFTGLNSIKPEMVEEATKNARTTAEKFAKDSDSKIGGIRSAYQGQFSIEDRDANTPYIKNVRVVNTVDYILE